MISGELRSRPPEFPIGQLGMPNRAYVVRRFHAKIDIADDSITDLPVRGLRFRQARRSASCHSRVEVRTAPSQECVPTLDDLATQHPRES